MNVQKYCVHHEHHDCITVHRDAMRSPYKVHRIASPPFRGDAVMHGAGRKMMLIRNLLLIHADLVERALFCKQRGTRW